MTGLRESSAKLAMQAQSSAATHVGKVRLLNEDRFLDAPEHGLWAVADGMGGHHSGDRAASAVIQALAALADRGDISRQSIERALNHANSHVRNDIAKAGATCGSTVAGLWLESDRALIFWLGDSRVYRMRGDELELMTHDHSLVQELLDRQLISLEQASSHPQANVITRALGVHAEPSIEWRSVEARDGDRFLLCTDGLSGQLAHESIATGMGPDAELASRQLIDQVLAGHASDNVTLIMLTLGEPKMI